MDHHRQSIRLPGYDYSQAGAYFVTIVTWHRVCLFGAFTDGQFAASTLGQVASIEWQKLGTRFPFASFDTFVVMPNHVHGIVVIKTQAEGGNQEMQTSGRLRPHSLGSVIGAYKSTTARLINMLRKTASAPVWLRNYYEHVIRDEAEWSKIYDYIEDNPRRWSEDEENPTRL
jgi:putative transposase